MKNYDEILKKARDLIEKEKPKASPQKKAAFANSVAYLVTGASGGYGGPSVREHVASYIYGPGGQYTFDQAVELLIKDDGVIFGPLTDLHRRIWENEYCFDDDPKDLKELSE